MRSRLQLQDRLADSYGIGKCDRGRGGDSLAVDVRAVRGAEILDVDAVWRAHHTRVASRDVVVLQDQLTIRATADHDHSAGQLRGEPGLVALGDHQDPRLPAMPLGPPCWLWRRLQFLRLRLVCGPDRLAEEITSDDRNCREDEQPQESQV